MKTRLLSLLLLLAATSMPVAASANHYQVARLARQLEQAAARLTHEVRSLAGYGSVIHHAQQLSRRAELLADSAERQNSSAYLRSRYSEVNRYYQSLENAVFRAGRNHGSRNLYQGFDQVAAVYVALDRALYNDYPRAPVFPERYSFSPWLPPSQLFLVPVPNRDPPHLGRHDDHNLYQRNDYRGNDNDRYDHRSPVLDRQQRRDDRDRSADRQARPVQGNNGAYRLGNP